MYMSYATYVDESGHIFECVVSHVYAACHIRIRQVIREGVMVRVATAHDVRVWGGYD